MSRAGSEDRPAWALPRAALAAFALLTSVPLPAARLTRDDRQRGVLFFPAVGLAFGGALAVCAPVLEPALGPRLSGLLLVALLALLSGGLHLDGWADLFDALGGGRGDRDRMLAIMRDPRLGAHGVLALCLLLLLKWEAFALAVPRLSAAAWLVLPAIARTAVAPMVALLPPARAEGLAHDLAPAHGGHRRLTAAAGAALGLAAAVALLAPALWLAALLALGAAGLLYLLSFRRLRGVTGDVHGAAIELAETTAVLAAALAPLPA